MDYDNPHIMADSQIIPNMIIPKSYISQLIDINLNKFQISWEMSALISTNKTHPSMDCVNPTEITSCN